MQPAPVGIFFTTCGDKNGLNNFISAVLIVILIILVEPLKKKVLQLLLVLMEVAETI